MAKASRASTRGFWSITASNVPSSKNALLWSVSSWPMKMIWPARLDLDQGLADPLIAGADIVDAGKIRMSLQERNGFLIGSFPVVTNFSQLDDFQIWKILAQDVAEAHLPFFMTTVELLTTG